MDGINFRSVVVEHVCPDRRNQSKEKSRKESGEGKEGAESVLLAKGKLVLVSMHPYT